MIGVILKLNYYYFFSGGIKKWDGQELMLYIISTETEEEQ